MADIGGYDFDVAEGVFHQCQICELILKEAVEIECTHIFCDACLKRWQNQPLSREGERFRCPVCNSLYQQHQVRRSGYLNRVIKYEMLVKCKRHNNGCPWVGSIDDFLQLHKRQCGYQIITCERCRKQYMLNKLQEHKLDCLFECPNDGCNQWMKQVEINNHRENECLHEDVPCLHSVYGCDVMVKRGRIEDHQQTSWRQHFQLFQNHYYQLREKLNNADLNIEQLRSSCLSADDRRKDWTFDELEDLLRNKSTRDKFNAIIASKPSLTKLRGYDNCTLLHMAAKYGATECIEVLIANDCDVKEKDEYGNMAIHRAAGNNNRTQVIEILLSRDPSTINATNNYNSTPLHYAALNNCRTGVELLLTRPSVDVNAKDVNGQTPDKWPRVNDEIKRMIRSHHNYSTSRT